MAICISKSSQDVLGRLLSRWRNARVAKEIEAPFLDIACGDNRLVKRNSGGIGIDVLNYGSANVIVRSFCLLPFRRGAFQTITIIASLNYFEEPQQVLSECERVLKTGGRLVLTLLNPLIGRLWHSLREKWVLSPGFTYGEVETFLSGTRFHLTRRTKFMLGMNNLYIFTKS